MKIFISYSWDDQEHRDWVFQLADHLDEEEDLDVIIDREHLNEHADRYEFMERSCTESDWVICIVNQKYLLKAKDKAGGVGVETQILRDRHYTEVEKYGSSRIIPIKLNSEAVSYTHLTLPTICSV